MTMNIVKLTAIGLLALGAGLTLRAGVPNLALGPIAIAAGLHWAENGDKGLVSGAVPALVVAAVAGLVRLAVGLDREPGAGMVERAGVEERLVVRGVNDEVSVALHDRVVRRGAVRVGARCDARSIADQHATNRGRVCCAVRTGRTCDASIADLSS